MASNLVSDGHTIQVTTPTGGYTSGQLVELVDMVGISFDAYAAGAAATLLVDGVFTLTKAAAADSGFSQGDSVYLTSTGLVNATATGDQYVGKAWAAAATGATSVRCRINWGPGNTLV